MVNSCHLSPQWKIPTDTNLTQFLGELDVSHAFLGYGLNYLGCGSQKLRYLSMFHTGVQVVTLRGLCILNQSFYLIYLSTLYTLHCESLLFSSILLFVPINILLLLFNKYNLSKLSLGLLTFIRLSEHCQESSPHRILTYK